MKGGIFGSSPVPVDQTSNVEEKTGKLDHQTNEPKLMSTVLPNDKKAVDQGRLIRDSINQGISSFTPDLFMEQLVKSYSLAKKIYGESLIRLISGYDPNYLKRNIHIPEFQRELQKQIMKHVDVLKEDRIIDNDNTFTEHAYDLAALALYTDELDKLTPQGVTGEKIHKKASLYGERQDTKPYQKHDRYRDIALKRSLKTAIRRGHTKLNAGDLKSFERESKGAVHLLYALDASGSMKGKKIEMCKRAGVALAYRAIQRKDKVGLIVFGTEVRDMIPPTNDFVMLLRHITKVRASRETNIAETLHKSIELFPDAHVTRHVMLITDALPTIGKDPERDVLDAVAMARSSNISVAVIGIQLDARGEELAKKIVEIGDGNLFICKNVEHLDAIILDDYYGYL